MSTVWASAHPVTLKASSFKERVWCRRRKNKHMEKYLRLLITPFRSPLSHITQVYSSGKLRYTNGEPWTKRSQLLGTKPFQTPDSLSKVPFQAGKQLSHFQLLLVRTKGMAWTNEMQEQDPRFMWKF